MDISEFPRVEDTPCYSQLPPYLVELIQELLRVMEEEDCTVWDCVLDALDCETKGHWHDYDDYIRATYLHPGDRVYAEYWESRRRPGA